MKNLVLITSIVHISTNPLSYSNTRSVFTPEERFTQIQKTIQSVREKIPHSVIFLIECSNITLEQEQYFRSHCDYFFNVVNEPDMVHGTTSFSKSLGEGILTIWSLEYIMKNGIEFDQLFKISGRYWLNDRFDYTHFNQDDICVHFPTIHRPEPKVCIDETTLVHSDIMVTTLYNLPKRVIPDWCHFLKEKIPDMCRAIQFENLFTEFVLKSNQPIYHIRPFGINGHVAVDNFFYDM